jgi:tryptophan 7-halogenase
MKNCVAIGLSSGFMEPLESTSIWMIQTGIARLLTMFPDKSFAPADIARYNRVLTGETEDIRDFLILHYKATQRNDTPFWDYCREMPVPDRLEEKMRVFMNAGRCFRENDELFNDTSWFAVMAGQLMQPRTYDPVANLLSLEETQTRLAQIRDAVAKSADYMPEHRHFIEDNCAA